MHLHELMMKKTRSQFYQHLRIRKTMIDLKAYRTTPDLYKKGAQDKWVAINWERFDHLDEELKHAKTELDALLAKRNTLSQQVPQLQKSWEDATTIIEEVRELKETIQLAQDHFDQLDIEHKAILLTIPSPAFEDVLVGRSDQENTVAEECGEKPVFDFEPKPHRDILEAKGYLDQERAVKISGARFQILRGKFAFLQFALTQWVIAKLAAKWFEMTLIPQLVKADALVTTGFLPNDSTNLYRVNPKTGTEQTEREEDDLWLIGTAEVALVSQYSDEFFEVEQLPKRYVGYSSSYRREAGTYGKDTKGLIRLHQFDKIEMVSFVKPEDSAKEHDMLLAIEKEIFTELDIPFVVLNICTGDLWVPAAKKRDLEAWFPGMETYKEVTSTSNTTDFQTRRGNIKVKDGKNKYYAHSLNGTAVALGRCLAAIVENYQTAEGDIRVPKVLQPFMGTDVI